MEQEYTYQSENYTIKIDSANGDNIKAEAYKAQIDDTTFNLDLAKVSTNCFSISFDGVSRTVHVVDSDDSIYVHIDGRVVQLGKVTNDVQKFSAGDMAYGEKDKIKAPMPGKVVKLLVSEGDKVEVGQPLVIVESMKMENEIKSPTDGTVKAINFKAGDLVGPEQSIIDLEPDEE